ncbi:hypothetical protein QJS10_CPB22g01507 [Acorus calamus]|uniref:HMA domain-containing protein n=1 Tax=Acorus calamus TaxID=4465 RepID=A0AAV9C1Q5_ACOCL|nr:hypothetical protein QJS10_CPB22g01507 [Acorus calamus]
METVELKVDMVAIHEKRLRRCLSRLKGIEKVEVEGRTEKVVVSGYVNKNRILRAIRRGGMKADFWLTPLGNPVTRATHVAIVVGTTVVIQTRQYF